MTFSEGVQWIKKRQHILFFLGGFLFDSLTIVRIDSVMDLAIQAVYLLAITWILIRQVRVERGHWAPTGRIAKVWEYETDAIHFFYGGLLSAYVILYFKSASASRSAVFLLLTGVLMFINEMPQVQRAGFKMRLGLHAFCVVSFLNYLIPILAGRMGAWTFALAVALTGVSLFYLIRHLIQLMPEPRQNAWWSLSWPPITVLSVIVFLYINKWIPPVPLSLQYIGVYHQIERENGGYRLIYPKPAFYRFWKHESSPFFARPEDVMHCFTRIFAPSRFTARIYMVWSFKNPATGDYVNTDRIPLPIFGGRGEGYRGMTAKSRYEPGHWRVTVETEDGRPIGSISFTVKPDSNTDERIWRDLRM